VEYPFNHTNSSAQFELSAQRLLLLLSCGRYLIGLRKRGWSPLIWRFV